MIEGQIKPGVPGYQPVPIEERLWSRTERDGDCLLWTGNCNNDGYGTIDYEGRTQKAHRVAWIVTFGPIPQGMCVCHRCDRPACIEPDHLFLGTHSDNMRDREQKGRAHRKYGADNHAAKLTVESVRALRQARADGASYPALGRMFGITTTAARLAATGQTWGHVV